MLAREVVASAITSYDTDGTLDDPNGLVEDIRKEYFKLADLILSALAAAGFQVGREAEGAEAVPVCTKHNIEFTERVDGSMGCVECDHALALAERLTPKFNSRSEPDEERSREIRAYDPEA